MGRLGKCVNAGLKKGAWTSEEDRKLVSFIQEHGHGSWCSLPAKAGLQRCGKICRLRWINYLRSDINRGKFSLEEERSIIQLHALIGNKWSSIASYLPKRTDNDIKNHWNTCLKKRPSKMGIDPSTHKPKVCHLGGFDLSHMAQWERARLEAETRLAVKSTSNFSVPPSLKGWQPWRRSINSGFFNPGGTLPSPTSILNFSAGLNGATAIFTASTSVGDVIVPPFLSKMVAKEETINIDVNDDDIIADLSAKPLVEPPSFLEGLTMMITTFHLVVPAFVILVILKTTEDTGAVFSVSRIKANTYS